MKRADFEGLCLALACLVVVWFTLFLLLLSFIMSNDSKASLIEQELAAQLAKLNKKHPRQPREWRVKGNFTGSEYLLVQFFAMEMGVSVSDYLRLAALRYGLAQPRSLPIDMAFHAGLPERPTRRKKKVVTESAVRRRVASALQQYDKLVGEEPVEESMDDTQSKLLDLLNKDT